jgi:hypothetical protein
MSNWVTITSVLVLVSTASRIGRSVSGRSVEITTPGRVLAVGLHPVHHHVDDGEDLGVGLDHRVDQVGVLGAELIPRQVLAGQRGVGGIDNFFSASISLKSHLVRQHRLRAPGARR